MERKHQILLYYGIEECESKCTVFHSFRAVDPTQPLDDEEIAAELAQLLNCKPDDDRFQCRDIYLPLPKSLVERIQEEAIQAYLEKGADHFIQNNPALAGQIHRIMRVKAIEEDIQSQLAQRSDGAEVPEAEIPEIAEDANNILSKSDNYWEIYWYAIDLAIDQFLKTKRTDNAPDEPTV